MAIGKDILGVNTATYGNVQGEIRILANKPELDKLADHVVEASLRFYSGILQVRDCTGSEILLAIPLSKTTYRIRFSSYNLGSVNGDEGDDYYTIEIWKSRFAKPTILKEYTS